MTFESLRKFKMDYVLLAAVVCLAFAPALSAKFVMDDNMNFGVNTFVHDWKNLRHLFTREYLTSPWDLGKMGQEMIGSGEGGYRPVLTLTYFLDYAVWKLNPFGYHLTNILLHLLCVCGVYRLLRCLVSNAFAAFVGALMFAVHPVQSEAVIIICMRDDILAAFFYLLTLNLYISVYHQKVLPKRAWMYGVMMVTALCAFLSKEMAITLPAALVLVGWFLHSRDGGKVSFLRWIFDRRFWGFYAAAVFYLWIWKFVMGRPEGFQSSYPGGSFYTNVLTMTKVFGIYLWWLVNPSEIQLLAYARERFVVMSFWNWDFLRSLAAFAGLGIGFWYASRKIPLLALAVIFMAVAILPASNLIPLENIIAARFLYIPMIGLAMAAALLWNQWFTLKVGERRMRLTGDFYVGAVFALGVFYILTIHSYHKRWADPLVLQYDMVKADPLHPKLRGALGSTYAAYENFPKAIEQFLVQKSLDPSLKAADWDLGFLYARIGDADKAILHLESAVRNFPQEIAPRHLLCESYAYQGHQEKYDECRRNLENLFP